MESTRIHDRILILSQPGERDADGFSAPPVGDDAISRAQQEAAAT